MKKSNIVLALVSVGLMTLSASMYAQESASVEDKIDAFKTSHEGAKPTLSGDHQPPLSLDK